MAYAVQLTAPGSGAIAVIRVAGADALQVIHQVTSAVPANLGEVRRATFQIGDPREPIDDGLVVYTETNEYELHLHGGRAVVASMVKALHAAGATIRQAEELASEANDLKSELLLTLPRAVTAAGLRLLSNQSRTGLTQWAGAWRAWLVHADTMNLWQLNSAAQWLLRRSRALDYLLSPPRIAIVGPPNAGKSTLANALLGRPVAITSDMPGTTRDWVDAQTIFTAGAESEVAVTLVDTAGLRQTPDVLEQMSIDRTHEQAAAADGMIVLFDATRVPSDEELALISRFARRRLVVALNKMDVANAIPSAYATLPNAVRISAQARNNLDGLMKAVLSQFDLVRVSPNEPFAFTIRQRSLLAELSLSGDPRSCIGILDTLTAG